jgi:hypothetical protein
MWYVIGSRKMVFFMAPLSWLLPERYAGVTRQVNVRYGSLADIKARI